MAAEATGVSGIAGRYATALYELADGAKSLDAVAADLKSIRAMIEASPELSRVIRSPLMGRDLQSKAVLAVLEAAKIGDLTRRFVGVVARNRRLFALPQLISAFLGLLATRRGEVTAHVASAQALTPDQTAAVTDALRKAMGSKIVVETKVDPSLIGGLVVRVGSRMVDTSIKTKLQKLQLAMKGIG